MAQLLKLEDYVSRYEWDSFRYPSQYIRMKKENWNKFYNQWIKEAKEAGELPLLEEEENTASQKKSTLYKFKFFKKRDEEIESPISEGSSDLPSTEAELKQYFLDKLLRFQLKWATSTMTQISYVDPKYDHDPLLKYFLQRFPDNYLLMYYPVFNLKNVPVDGEIFFISPIGIEIIHVLEREKDAVIMVSDERTWTIETKSTREKIISPMLALRRTEKIIKSILQSHGLHFPIEKTVLSRTNNIVFHVEPYNTKIIGKNEYDQWFQEKRRLHSPLKNRQLKVASILLQHCQTNSVKRPEWEEDIRFSNIGNSEE